jgi:hypothetical protein
MCTSQTCVNCLPTVFSTNIQSQGARGGDLTFFYESARCELGGLLANIQPGADHRSLSLPHQQLQI